jgi:hypothetical protein
VLFSAAEQSMLIGVLANWEPELDWPARSLHIERLAKAAASLVRGGLINVYQEHVGAGEAALLFRDDAVDAVGNRDNWWHEDTDADLVGDVNSKCAAFYSIAVTDDGLEVLRTRGDDSLFAYRNH